MSEQSYDKEHEAQEPLICFLEIDYPLKSKSNYRRSPQKGGRGDEWLKQRKFEEGLALAARAARPANWPLGDVSDSVAKRPGYVVLIVARTTLDTANMAKSVTDALEGVLFHNDASVRLVSCGSFRTRTAQRALIIVSPIRPGASMHEVLERGSLLGRVYLEAESNIEEYEKGVRPS